MNEIIFLIEQAADGGYVARAVGHAIFTDADNLSSLCSRVRDAVRCHFEQGQPPQRIRLQFMREEDAWGSNNTNDASSEKRWIGLSDDEIDLSDIPEVGKDFAEHARMRGPLVQKNTVLVDTGVYEWFERQGPDYQQRINHLLRNYMDAQKNAR